MQVKIGDLFYTSWGYDQTNYDYIVVVGISPSGKTAICQRTSHKHLGDTEPMGQAFIQKPINKPFGDKFRLRIEYHEDRIYLRGSYPYIHTGLKDDGTRLDTFFKVKDDKQVFYETNPVFGH